MTGRVAITGVSGDVGLGVIKALRTSGRDFFLLGLDASSDCAGFHLVDAHHRPPLVKDPGYIDAISAQLMAHDIECLFLGIDQEIPLWAEHRTEVEQKTGAQVLVASPDFVHHASDKVRTQMLLDRAGLPHLPTCGPEVAAQQVLEQLGLPLVVKPRAGHGSSAISICHDETSFLSAWLSTDAPCAQRYVEGPEYTCGLLFDRDGALCDTVVCERGLRDGRTMWCRPRTDGFLDDFFARLAPALTGARGAINVQLRLDEQGTPRVFEINPRLSGSTAMRVALGVNDPIRLYDHFVHGQAMPRHAPQEATVFRHWTELVVA